ncbi:YkoP family protein [Brevibacillus dissolubilis]|uniref:YkoP family protein n=1 Tax=Brevibacillus dissolubilis TaxID=1844116 RepID=UPI001115DC3D|nr:hypothetical protein [Brevibacillus dissolubilis]
MNIAILSLWGVWDAIYFRCTRLQYVEKGSNIFRFVLLPYRGEPLDSNDGLRIERGDLILRLHIHNYYFATLCKDIENDTKIILMLRRHIRDSLPQLAEMIADHPRRDEIKGIVGTTMLHRGVEPLGFTTSFVPERWFFRYKRWYLRLMMMMIHPDGIRRIRRGEKDYSLKRVYMSRQELFDRYLS